VHGEGDGLPSLIVDRYADYLVVQTLSQAAEALKQELAQALVELLGPKGILERNDPRVRQLEGLDQRIGLLHGDVPAAVELAEGGVVRFGELRLTVLHTPGHTEGSVCLYSADDGLLLSGDTLFAGGWGRVDLPGGDPEAMVTSLTRLLDLEDRVAVLPGHGRPTSIGRERAWLEMVRDGGRLLA
jgi:glyoxylase-like metal-dependent hydrolase (beta-lactamase superfamily II)